MSRIVALALAAAFAAAPTARAADDEARPRDLERLREDLANLQADLDALEPGDRKAGEFRQRAEVIHEEAIYLKVKMRKHQEARRDGTGVGYDEVADLRRQVANLRDDIDRAFGRRASRDSTLDAGTRIAVRLDEPLSSRTARREDRFEASVYEPVRASGGVAIPAGTRMRGVVVGVEQAERPSKGGRLELEFDRLYLDRSGLDMRGRVAALGEETSGEKAEKAGIGAVIGGVLGGILGGKKGAIVGVVLGGGGAIAATKGEEAEIPAGTILTLRLEEPLTVPRR